jgi:hypothetical protein
VVSRGEVMVKIGSISRASHGLHSVTKHKLKNDQRKMRFKYFTRDNNFLINGWCTRKTRAAGTGFARVQIFQPVPVPQPTRDFYPHGSRYP